MEFKLHERISDRHLVGETIRIGDDWAESIVRCMLENCHIIVDVPRGGPGIYDSQLQDCTIETKKRMKDAWFFSSDYTRCKFKGKFLGMDFGRSPWPHPRTGEMDKYGELIDCDFTAATLDLCRFFNVDISKQKFAPWPQFVISMEQYRKAAAMERGWPGKLGIHISGRLKENSHLSAVTGTKSDFMKRYALTEEELEQSLQAIGGVIR